MESELWESFEIDSGSDSNYDENNGKGKSKDKGKNKGKGNSNGLCPYFTLALAKGKDDQKHFSFWQQSEDDLSIVRQSLALKV